MDEFANNFDIDDAFEFDHSSVHGSRIDTTQNHKITTQAVYSFVKTRQPNPGGANVFALRTYGTPPFNVIGNAFMVRRMPHPLEPAVQTALAGTVQSSVGGLMTGNAYSQPLYDENTDTYGGLPYSAYDVGELD